MINAEKIMADNVKLRNENKALRIKMEKHNNDMKILQNRARSLIAELNNSLFYNDNK